MAVEVREVRPEDAEAVLAARDLAPDPVRRLGPGLAEWRWAHERNPAGGRAVAGFVDGRVVAHAAALAHVVWMGGRERGFAELVDTFVVPAERGELEAGELYPRLVRELLAPSEGPVGERTVLYGWPASEEWKRGRDALGYEVVRTQTVLTHEVARGPTEPPDGVESIEPFDEQARWLWDRCSGAFGASIRRDAAFLNWRFVEHPSRRYRVFGVRDGEGTLRGYAVYRRAAWPRDEVGFIVDWLVPPEEPEVGELLLRAVLATARREGLERVSTIVPEWSPWFESFQTWGFLVFDAGLLLFARPTARKFDDLWLRENWWFTGADSVAV